jgi:hypothetical protein
VINFRFHLISLVAVFLALGVGVAMGASFVDRATVDTLRGRVDALDAGFRQRGAQNDALREQLAASDAQAAALAVPGSPALAERLQGQPVVLVVPDGVPAGAVDAVNAALDAADATPSGAVRLLPPLDVDAGAGAENVSERLGIGGFTAEELSARVIEDLAASLALLSGGSGSGAGATTTTTTTTIAPGQPGELVPADPGDPGEPSPPDAAAPTGAVLRPTDTAGARAYLDALVQLGLIAIDTAGAAPGAEFPAVVGVQYVIVVAAETRPDSAEVVIPLAEATARVATAVVTVAEARPLRPVGEATTTVPAAPAPGALLAPLREGPSSSRLSTVDDLDEAFGAMAVPFAVAQHRAGSVGQYGTGAGATAPFPTVPAP